MTGSEGVAGPLSGQVGIMADTHETGTNKAGRVAQAMTEVGGREKAHMDERERERERGRNEWDRRLATFSEGGIRTPVEFSRRE